MYFNPLFPYGKRRCGCWCRTACTGGFQSTLPIREETYQGTVGSVPDPYFNPLFPYGKRRRTVRGRARRGISIHSSHTGRDPSFLNVSNPLVRFQSTLPIREETGSYGRRSAVLTISIHSSHTGRDNFFTISNGEGQISIHSSHTGRDPSMWTASCSRAAFQSTLPIREETLASALAAAGVMISIHSSHTGRDDAPCSPLKGQIFQSTLPIREETGAARMSAYRPPISIHSSHTGRDQERGGHDPHRPFQSTLPIREETANAYNLSARKVVASAQHRLIFDSSLLFPAVQNWFWG